MKPSLLSRLDRLVDRHEELAALLVDPEVIGNQAQFIAFSQEYSEIGSVVLLVQKYRVLSFQRHYSMTINWILFALCQQTFMEIMIILIRLMAM